MVVRCLHCGWSGFFPASNPEKVCFLSPPERSNINSSNQTEESSMDVLNTVVNILHLLAEVVIGVLQVTWMISKDVFRDKPKAKHYSRNKK